MSDLTCLTCLTDFPTSFFRLSRTTGKPIMPCRKCDKTARIDRALGRATRKPVKGGLYPMAPLLAMTRLTLMQLAETVANTFDPELVRHWGRRGVPDHAADRLAVMLGEHPARVWPEWIDVGLSMHERAEEVQDERDAESTGAA